jgi:thioredoxin reductase/bacterioferritin-associated ferredoxin
MTENTAPFPLAVIGAGPAGLAAAVTAARAGGRVLLVDAGVRPGGQFWRHGGSGSASARGEGHHDWRTFTRLQDALDELRKAGRVTYLPGTHVWMVRPGPAGGFLLYTVPTADASAARSAGGDLGSVVHTCTQLAICAGAYDRQLPIPGWDLPGVMAAGGIQAFIKTNGFAPGTRAVVGGTGPFLMPVAAGLAHAGAQVAAVCEANSPTRWLPYAHRAIRAPEKGLEGAGYAATFARHRIPYRLRTRVVRALGEDRLEAVVIARVDARGGVVAGSERRIDCDLLGLGWGFTPLLELPVSLGADTHVDADGSLVVTADGAGRTSVPGLWSAGETTGVGGAALAVAEGQVLGEAVASADVAPSPALRRRTTRLRAFATGMHQAYPVPEAWQETVEQDTLVCRCEEVTAGQIREAATELGAQDVRSTKSFTRAGMGWCQGRECAFAVSCMTSPDPTRPDPEALRAGTPRPMSSPVRLGALAALDTTETSERKDPS